jgi:hypothetical protein
MVLPNLLWLQQGPPQSAAMMWPLPNSSVSNPTPIIQDFEFGWNWTAMPWNAGALMGIRRFHCGDLREKTDSSVRMLDLMKAALMRDGIPNMQLVPCVKGIGQAEGNRRRPRYSTELDKEQEGTNPSEAVAIEFAPWLEYVDTIKRFAQLTDDSSGAVFGWRTRRRGGVTSANGIYRMRYSRRTSGDSSTTPILEDVLPDGELRAWTPWNSPYTLDIYDRQNTSYMELAVTLRRVEDNHPDSSPEDEILTIELPYALGEDTTLNRRIRFDSVSTQAPAFLDYVDLQGRLLARIDTNIVAVTTTMNSQRFIIKRGMLPVGDTSDLTLIAHFKCKGDTINNNPQLRDESSKTADNTEIGKLGITVWHNDDPETGLGIELRSIRLQTPEAGRLFTGQHDERIQRSANRFLEDLKTMQDSIQASVSGPRIDPSFKVWMFYGRDEGPKCYWKSYRYINTLLDYRLITEVNIEDAKDFLHATKFKVLWQGAAPTTNPQNATYSYERGYNTYLVSNSVTNHKKINEGTVRSFAGIRYGLGDMRSYVSSGTTVYRDDPDTYLDWRTAPTVGGIQIPAALPLSSSETDSVLKLLPRDLTRGVLSDLEQTLILDYQGNREMLFGGVPWLGHAWLNYHMQVRKNDNVDTNFAWFLNNRPRTLGETRTALWLPLILGAKGLMFYRGTTSREGSGEPFHATPSLFVGPNDQPADNLEGGLIGFFNQDSLARGSMANSVDSAWLRSIASGDDWISAGDPTHVDAYFYPSLNKVAANLRGLSAASAQDSIYVGTHTNRNVTLDVLDKLQDMRTKLGRGSNGRSDTMPHILTTLRLESWYGHGFTTISISRDTSNPLARYVDISHIRERLRTRHPYRNTNVVASSQIPGHVSYESYDSSFFDITMMSLDTDREMANSCVISVLNRRTDPRMLAQSSEPGIYRYVNASTSQWSFAGYQEWAARGASGRLDQRGTRQITLPFNYKNTDGAYRLLRLQEMGGGIDTIIGQDREIAINLLPGEGKMFRVTVLEGEKPADMQGWLAHNTQRKVVVYPTLVKDNAPGTGAIPNADQALRTQYDTTFLEKPTCSCMDAASANQVIRAREAGGFRYHVVYHMKEDSSALLKVYYRRSQLLSSVSDSASSVDSGGIYNPAIVWEDPIALDTFIRQDSTTYRQSTNCGYPSLVVRDDPHLPADMNPCVYVVYACQNNGVEDIAICEARFGANAASRTEQVQLYHSNRSNVIAYSKAFPSCPDEFADRLRNWGTPVIGATMRGNFYAWSDYRVGIVAGFKRADAAWFADGSKQSLKMHPGNGVVAQFPSLPSYTKMALGEDDIPLVWQEGALGRNLNEGSCTEGEHILYTRLFHNGDVVEHRLQARGQYNPVPPLLERINNILCLSDHSDVDVSRYNRKPTIYRQMSEYDDAEMDTTNPLQPYGYANHKADRIAWEHREIHAANPTQLDSSATAMLPGYTANKWRIQRMSIDCWDSCASDTAPNRLWHSAVSNVYHDVVNLRNPELIQGEQKTVLHANSSSDQLAQSWAYGDTSVVLSFNSESQTQLSRVYHMTFLDGYYRDQAVVLGQINGLGWAALDVTMRSSNGAYQGERMPHVAARHSIVHSPSLLKNRRFSESALLHDQATVYRNATYLPTPSIDRSARGFFKETDEDFIPRDRIWRGYRSEQFDALLSDIRIDNNTYELRWDAGTSKYALHTDWFQAQDVVELELKTLTSGESAAMAHAALERESDHQIVELPVLGVRGQMLGAAPSREPLQYQWTVLTDPAERYRLVLTATDPQALAAEDVEMAAHKEPFARSSASSAARNIGLLDGYAMRLITDTITAERLDVWPHPASEDVTLMCRVPSSYNRLQTTGKPAQITLDIYNLAGDLVGSCLAAATPSGLINARLSVSSFNQGFYTIAARGLYPIRGMMIVKH